MTERMKDVNIVPYQVVVTYKAANGGHSQQTYNCLHLDAVWAKITLERAKANVMRIRVMTEIACFEVD